MLIKIMAYHFFGGKQLLELNPNNVKYLSLDQHSQRISEQLCLKENMIAVTCSGQVHGDLDGGAGWVGFCCG